MKIAIPKKPPEQQAWALPRPPCLDSGSVQSKALLSLQPKREASGSPSWTPETMGRGGGTEKGETGGEGSANVRRQGWGEHHAGDR